MYIYICVGHTMTRIKCIHSPKAAIISVYVHRMSYQTKYNKGIGNKIQNRKNSTNKTWRNIKNKTGKAIMMMSEVVLQ